MAKVKIQGHASGTGIFTVTAPNSSTDRTITLPDNTGALLTNSDDLPAANLTGTVASARITASSIANDLIDSQHYAAASIDNEHLADDAVGVAELSATGTASSSTFLRGDNSWQTAGVSTLAALTDSTVSASDPAITANPSATGHLWLNSSSGEAYVCTTATTNANVWTNIGPGTGDIVPPYNVDFLVIAGGAGGGSSMAGGGGAGGYRNSYNSETSGGGGSSETNFGADISTV